jgi:hypothetical protein
MFLDTKYYDTQTLSASGPMFFKYGAVLRKGPEAQKDPKANTYVTTIFCIVSGIMKLSRIMELPEERCVFVLRVLL